MERIDRISRGALDSPAKIIGFLLVVLVALGVLGAAVTNSFPTVDEEETGNQAEEEAQDPIANYALLYGDWANEKAQIFAYDLEKRQEYVLATLPINIKKVTQLSSDQLLFIAETNEQDHGNALGIYTISTGKTSPFYTADEGFGIDDYQISPDLTTLAVWEVQFAPETSTLRGGTSRVYTTKVTTPGSKNLLYDESATGPVHYPVAVTNTGEIFLDRFLANTGAGWAYGMSTSDFTGSTKSDLANMQQGTYGTQPTLSPDGRYLLFGGYSGSRGNGNDSAGNFRRALVSLNTVDLLDTSTKERTSLPLPQDNRYSEISWEQATSNIKLIVLSKSPDETGAYLYNLDTQALSPADSTVTTANKLIADLGEVKIYGTNNNTGEVIGNLGASYGQPYSHIFAQLGGQDIEIPTSVALSQIIGLVDSSSINPNTLTTVDTAASNNVVQLSSFDVKPELKEQREYQQQDVPEPPNLPNTPKRDTQNLPKCRDLASAQCNDLMNVNYTSEQAVYLRSVCVRASGCRKDGTSAKDVDALSDTEQAYAQCVYSQWTNNAQEKSCTDSPLYLYGPDGLEVKVKIHTPIFNANIPSTEGSYSFQLKNDGLFANGESTYSALTFDYTQALYTKPPMYGKVVKKEDLESTIKEYAKKLDLNTRETNDLVKDTLLKATGKYIFISYYSQKASKLLLPMTFDPRPDTYINYVFYMRNLNSPQGLGYTPSEPKFEKIEPRGKFTAVEISLSSN